MAIKRDYTLDVLRILDQLKDVAVDKPRKLHFVPITLGYDPEEVYMLIEKVRASLPRELKDAATVNRESERIIESANEDARAEVEQAKREAERLVSESKQEAARLLEQARLQQEQLLSESEVLKLAKAQSEEMRNATERDCQQMRRGADRYAHDVLSKIEGTVGKLLATVERGKAELENTADTALVAPTVRERVKVQ